MTIDELIRMLEAAKAEHPNGGNTLVYIDTETSFVGDPIEPHIVEIWEGEFNDAKAGVLIY